MHAYFSTLMSSRSIGETTLIQDNSAGASGQQDRREIMTRWGKGRRCEHSGMSNDVMPTSASRFTSSSVIPEINDSVLLAGENRWGSETLDSSEHSSMDVSAIGSSNNSNSSRRLSFDKPKRPPRRRSSPTIVLDETDLEHLHSFDQC